MFIIPDELRLFCFDLENYKGKHFLFKFTRKRFFCYVWRYFEGVEKMFANRWYHPIFTKIKCTQNFSKNCIQRYASTSQSQESRRRVVVTGIGVVSPVGCGAEIAWKNILNGVCGIKRLRYPAYETLPCKIAAKIDDDELKLSEQFSKSELRSLAPATAYALLAGIKYELTSS